jgi:hypothetical protein
MNTTSPALVVTWQQLRQQLKEPRRLRHDLLEVGRQLSAVACVLSTNWPRADLIMLEKRMDDHRLDGYQ